MFRLAWPQTISELKQPETVCKDKGYVNVIWSDSVEITKKTNTGSKQKAEQIPSGIN